LQELTPLPVSEQCLLITHAYTNETIVPYIYNHYKTLKYAHFPQMKYTLIINLLKISLSGITAGTQGLHAV